MLRGGVPTGADTTENSVAGPREINSTITERSSNPTSNGSEISISKTHGQPCSLRLYSQAKERKHPKCPSADEWNKRGWRVRMRNAVSRSLTQGGTVPPAAPRMDFESTVLSEINQAGEDEDCGVLFLCRILGKKNKKTRRKREWKSGC